MAELTNEQIEADIRISEASIAEIDGWQGPMAELQRQRIARQSAALTELLAARETIKRLEGLEAKWRRQANDAQLQAQFSSTGIAWERFRSLTQAADELHEKLTTKGTV